MFKTDFACNSVSQKKEKRKKNWTTKEGGPLLKTAYFGRDVFYVKGLIKVPT